MAATNSPEESEIPVHTVSNKSVVIVATTLITTVGLVAAAYYSNRHPVPESIQPQQLKALQREYVRLADTVKEFEFDIAEIRRDDLECQYQHENERANKKEHAKEFKELSYKVDTYQAKTTQRDNNQDMLIERCMRATQ